MGDFYNTGVVMMHPRDCGVNYDDVTDEYLRSLSPELTPEEAQDYFVKHYYQKEMPRPAQALLAACENGPMDPKEAYLPTEIGEKFLRPIGALTEMGYCVLPDGTGYVAVSIDQPGRTDEKMRKYNEKFAPFANCAYKIWFPGAHLMHFTDGCYEDFGWGPLKIRFQGQTSFKDIGLTEEMIREKDPDTLALSFGSNYEYNPYDPEKRIEYCSCLTQLRKIPGGRQLRVRHWFGARINLETGELERKTHFTPAEMEEHMRMMLTHLLWEDKNVPNA